ncbi:MAG TPA: OmpH family outer membrane protein, partial [Tabrizicola sp.]|nr:OmpH family outer membrane protein [Tabrizicola sp.]
ERIRAEQDEKARRLVEKRDQDRQEFLKLAGPVLGDLLGERQATAILDKSLVIVSLSAIDITDEAIAKLNTALSGADAKP